MDHQPNHVWLPEAAALDDSDLAIVARSMIAARKALHNTLPSELIHDTALDILLNLFVARSCNQEIAVDDVVQYASVRREAVLRWIAVLGQYDLVLDNNAECKLTDSGVRIMRKTLTDVSMSQWQFSD